MNVINKRVVNHFKNSVNLTKSISKKCEIKMSLYYGECIANYISSLEKENEKLFLDNQELREMLYY